jgi:protein phosphatase
LCSDGLFAVVGDDTIAGILGDRSLPLDEVCRQLIDAANAAGGPDNITTLVLQVDVP